MSAHHDCRIAVVRTLKENPDGLRFHLLVRKTGWARDDVQDALVFLIGTGRVSEAPLHPRAKQMVYRAT